MKNIFKFLFLSLFILPFSSCRDRDFQEEFEEIDQMQPPQDQYALSFMVTLDRMGGTTSTRAVYFNPMEEIESYIDPKKFRVLFFDSQERFLFESKSRWVKKESEDAGSTTWYVSVPIYNYGNDDKYNWDFESIRDELTKNSFQIVLMVNRPLYEYAAEYKTQADGGGVSGWFENDAPHWGKEDSRFTDGGENTACKKIFDIHHSQYDAVYENKSMVQGIGTQQSPAEGYYNFIMDEPTKINHNTDNNTHAYCNTMLSSAISWVDWDGQESSKPDAEKDNFDMVNGVAYRRIIHPSHDKPIPMYGTQIFSAINPDAWQKGTTFHLTRGGDLPVSLLRSCVKVELILPKEPQYITIWYSNIYSRCEPIDIWTPTNEIWCKGTDSQVCAEMDAIMENGPLSTSANNTGMTVGFKEYQYKLSWFYGKWLDRGWKFGSLTAEKVKPAGNSYGYPRIFNPMIQRNQTISYGVGRNPVWKDNLGYYHAIVYTGERNVNDPSNLSSSSTNSENAGNRTLFVFVYKMKDDSNVYSTPITNYSYSASHPARNITPDPYSQGTGVARSKAIDTYATTVSNVSTDKNYRPFPLMRNHVYRLFLKTTGPLSRGETGYEVESEVSSSKSIVFPEAIKRFNIARGLDQEKPTAKLDISTIQQD